MEPRHLKAEHGWQWIKQGFALFMKAPLLWIVLLVICFIAAALLSAIPILGDILSALLTPAITAGLMAGCYALENGDDLELAHLFSGFRQHTTQLVTLGGISVVAQLLILGAMMATGGSELVTLMTAAQSPQDPQILFQAAAGAGFAILLGVVLFSIWMMAMLFAPMLVFFGNIAPIESLKLSFRAFLVNIGPMLVYGLVMITLAILASVPIMLGWLVLFPVLVTSSYTCYCDIFPLPTEIAADTEKPIEDDSPKSIEDGSPESTEINKPWIGYFINAGAAIGAMIAVGNFYVSHPGSGFDHAFASTFKAVLGAAQGGFVGLIVGAIVDVIRNRK